MQSHLNTRQPILETTDLCGGYYHSEIIRDFSCTVNPGDFIGFIGPNGSGKTTLLRLLSRALAFAKGNIFFKGQPVSSIGLKAFARKAAFVPQETAVNFPFTVAEIVLLGRIPHLKRMHSETRNDIQIAEHAMELTDTLHLKEKNITEISLGERQRVIIAKAIAQQPELLFLDEPTAHLDIGHQIQILDLLKRLNRDQGLTIIMAIHDLNLAGAYCNRMVLLSRGKVFKEGHPKAVLTYQNIEAVYKTVVVVKDNPLNDKPYVLLVPQEK